jgi:phosphoribosyl-ATP pyrophosphohydrolase
MVDAKDLASSIWHPVHYTFIVIVFSRPIVWEACVTQPLRPLDELERTIAARAQAPSEKSYTSRLLAGGVEKIGAKVIEEAAEIVEAAGEPGQAGREHFIREVADLIYHVLVLMRQKKCTLADVEAELAGRFGVSGIEEKAARKN